MSKVNSIQLGSTLVSCFIGAALVSGKELWQFFGVYGYKGYVGLILAIGLLATFSYMLMTIAQNSGVTDMTRVLFAHPHPLLQAVLGSLQALFMFGIYAVMLSGAGALVAQLFPQLPGGAVIGASLLCAAVTVTVLQGVSGVIRVASAVTPLLIIVTVTVAGIALWRADLSVVTVTPQSSGGPLLQNWLLSALNFVSYNFFCAIGMIAPLGALGQPAKIIRRGAILCGVFLLTLSAAIAVSLQVTPAVQDAELPMLALATTLSPVLQYVYAVLLLLAMFSASVAVLLPLPDFLKTQWHCKGSRTIHILLCGVFAFIGSFCGFGNLIDYLYPIFGYLAFFDLLLLIYRFISIQRNH